MNLIDHFADWLNARFDGVTITDIAQSIIAAITLLVAPASIQSLWTRYRYKIRIELQSLGDKDAVTALAWRAQMRNCSESLLAAKIDVYPKFSGADLRSLRVEKTIDGGLHIGSVDVSNGAAAIIIERMAPGRVAQVSIRFNRPSKPAFHSSGLSIGVSAAKKFRVGKDGRRLTTQRIRLEIVLLHIFVAFALLVTKLLALGVAS